VNVNPGKAGRTQEVVCDEYLARHSEYLDGLLSPAMSARLSAHAGSCDSCARYDRIVRRGIDLVRDLPDVEPSEDFELRLQHRIFHVEDARVLPSRGTGAAVALGVAAAIALLAWSPMLVDNGSAPMVASQSFQPEPATDLTTPRFGADAWYPLSLPLAPAHQPATLLAAFPGPYSPLVVTPPAHRSVRSVSTELGSID
jgi:anti-sigma factor RsiW